MYLSIYLSIYLSKYIYLSIYLSIYISIGGERAAGRGHRGRERVPRDGGCQLRPPGSYLT